jgi:transcription antitermination factor NusB
VDKRTRARELAMQAVYQLDVQGEPLFEFLDAFFVEYEPDDSVRRQAAEWTKGAWDNLAECDAFIEASTIKWHLSRLSPVDKSILRLAVYQLKFCGDIPPRVVINEAIELAKKFSTERSPSFVNGVLDAAMKRMKAADEQQVSNKQAK